MTAPAPPPARPPSVVILLADGVRPDTFSEGLDSGELPALARLRDEGSLRTLSSCFPSVTGPAYAPFLVGRFPGPVGLPGLRWYDRSRDTCGFPDYARSYVGYQVGRIDTDIATNAPTIFELTDRSFGALSMIYRGLPVEHRIAPVTLAQSFRGALAHFTGDVDRALAIDRDVAIAATQGIRDLDPEFAFVAFGTPDKISHARGHRSPRVMEALRIVDGAAATIRDDAERDGRWESMHLWVTSDHGHSSVGTHEDLVRVIRALGHRAMAHPWSMRIAPTVGVMVSGNSMAHIYLELERRDRPWWPSLAPRWGELADVLLARDSVDLMTFALEGGALVRARGRGDAILLKEERRYSYRRCTGDPLGIGTDLDRVTSNEAYDATIASDYPDALVQITELVTSSRAGEIILSASREWDFRARFEPIDHVSSHGALHREHMLVPLLTNRPIDSSRTPRRTVDVMPAALAVLGKPIPAGLDGRAFPFRLAS